MLAYVFPGQGAQYPGMAADLTERYPQSKAVMEKISQSVGWDVAKLCREGTAEQLQDTANAQLCMLGAELAALEALRAEGIQPQLCAGFSLGEYAALVCAGVLGVEETAVLVQNRSQYMARYAQGGMAAVLGLPSAAVEELCAQIGNVWPANYNCPGQIVVSGLEEALAELEAQCKAQKVRMMRLKVSGAFHSPVMDPAARLLAEDLAKIRFASPVMPLVFNATAGEFGPEETVADLLARQCNSPVRWEESVHCLLALGATSFVECGPGKAIAGFMKRISPETPVYSAQDVPSIAAAVAPLKA
jgi:[acyl-carrier-protein] S-malonyltransferase